MGKTLQQAITPFAAFIKVQLIASVLLLSCTIAALIWANSDYSESYFNFFETPFYIGIEHHEIRMSLRHWISDGLMALFFYILGLAIKREILAGELKDRARSTTIIAAAIGGMLFPALFYFAFNVGKASSDGWGIPMATDAAFAIGVLALLRSRVPSSLTMFVTALAIIDDIGAILVIAFFYTSNLYLPSFITALSLTGLLFFLNYLNIRQPWVYWMFGAVIWYALHTSGVHATIAGILVAMATPARPKLSSRRFLYNVKQLVSRFEITVKQGRGDDELLGNQKDHEVVEHVAANAEHASTPLRRWEHQFEYPVALFVMPLFALANAGISIDGNFLLSLIQDPISIGIIVGLVFGKLIGIFSFTYIAVKLGWGTLPNDVNFKHIFGIGLLAGIGFTMSVFIANLAFSNPNMFESAKAAVFIASIIAGVSGYLWLRYQCDNKPAHN